MDGLNPDCILFLCAMVIAALCVLLWIFAKARANVGVAELPSMLMFGWGCAAWGAILHRDKQGFQ